MSALGYQQAIENVAYEIDRLSEELFQSGEPITSSMFNLMQEGQDAHERAKKLDIIITMIAETYHRTEDDVDRDINIAIQQRVLKYSENQEK